MSQTATPTSNLQGFLGSDPGVNRLLDNVMAQVPAVIQSVVKLAAWNAIEDFYLRSTARRAVVNWQMAAGVQSIDFNPYDEQWLVAWVLHFKGLYRFRVTPPALVIDRDYPQQLRTGTALLALKPMSYGVGTDPLLFEQWFETILQGTLMRLYGMPSKPYSSPELAKFCAAQFTHGIARARASADAEYTDGPGRWHFPYFALGRRKS